MNILTDHNLTKRHRQRERMEVQIADRDVKTGEARIGFCLEIPAKRLIGHSGQNDRRQNHDPDGDQCNGPNATVLAPASLLLVRRKCIGLGTSREVRVALSLHAHDAGLPDGCPALALGVISGPAGPAELIE
jgi:hypothetical protein